MISTRLRHDAADAALGSAGTLAGARLDRHRAPAPTGPASAVLAFTLTCSTLSRQRLRDALAHRQDVRRHLGACATMVLSTLTICQPACSARRPASAAAPANRRRESARRCRGSGGRYRPAPARRSMASVMAWHSASASEWPSSPCVCGMVTPPSTSGRPGTAGGCPSPSPMRMLGRFMRFGRASEHAFGEREVRRAR